MKRECGFSLIELLLSLIIMALIAGYAIPHYQNFLIESRRMEAKQALEYLALSLDHYYNQKQTYEGASLDQLHISAYTKNKDYQLIISHASNKTFSISAIPQGSQNHDTTCGQLSLDSYGNESASGSSPKPQQDCW